MNDISGILLLFLGCGRGRGGRVFCEGMRPSARPSVSERPVLKCYVVCVISERIVVGTSNRRARKVPVLKR